MSDELKPCPFCGTVPKIVNHIHGGVNLCHRPGEDKPARDCFFGNANQQYSSAEKAIAAWNTRAAKPAVKLPQCYEIADNIVMSGGTLLALKRDGRLLMTADVLAMLKLAGIDIQPLPEGPRA